MEKSIYLSSGQVVSLKEIAEKSVQIVSRYNGGHLSKIVFEESNIQSNLGMNCSLLHQDINWHPKYTVDDMIDSLCIFFTDSKVNIDILINRQSKLP